MGFSTPKTPFNLAEFLSEKAPPRSSRKPSWKRSMARSANVAETESVPDATEASEEGAKGRAADEAGE
jgi:hypothetical protein